MYFANGCYIPTSRSKIFPHPFITPLLKKYSVYHRNNTKRGVSEDVSTGARQNDFLELLTFRGVVVATASRGFARVLAGPTAFSFTHVLNSLVLLLLRNTIKQ